LSILAYCANMNAEHLQRYATACNARAPTPRHAVRSDAIALKRERCIALPVMQRAGTAPLDALLNSRTNQVRLGNDVPHYGVQLEQHTMTRTARKPANHASTNQLSFLFADAPGERLPEPIAIATPAPLTAELARPLRARAPRRARATTRAAQIVPAEDRRLTVEEAADLLSVSVKTLEAWRRLGRGPEFVKLGRAVRYTMRALDAFTRARTVRNSAEGRMLDASR